MEEVKHSKCSGCRCWREDNDFLNDKGRKLKTCNVCRDKYKCDECDSKFGTNSNLQKHILTVHRKEQNYSCSECEYKTGQNGSLQKHIKTVHKKEQNYSCEECDKKFGTNGHLQSHIKTVHLKEQNYSCKECDSKFGTNGNLQIHIRTVHLQEQNYSCEECDSKFGENSNLQKHILTVHRKEQNYSCSECEYKTGQNGSLQKHIKTVHLKEKNYYCDECDSKFGTNSNLQSHIKICTGEMNCSSGEYAVMKVLDDMKIEYQYNSTYKVKSKGLLRWDFHIEYGDKHLFIEYNGKQHYEPVEYFGGEEQFKKQQEHDKIKDDFCKENDHPLLWISYKDYGRINELVADFIIENTNWND